MNDALKFMMGQHEAVLPADCRYAKNHMWAKKSADAWRFGFSAYAVRLLQDVYFLDWSVAAPSRVAGGQEIGSIESKKAESSLYAPIDGRLRCFNEALMADPSAINVDTYHAGWLFEIEGPGRELLTPQQYIRHLDEVWVVTQRTVKGQLNE